MLFHQHVMLASWRNYAAGMHLHTCGTGKRICEHPTSSLESAKMMSLSSGAANVPLVSQDLKNLMRPS